VRICVIVNPYANRWRARRRWGEFESALRARRADVEVRHTAAPRDARGLAADAARDGFDAVVAAGGDGTVHEALNGLMSVDDSRRPALGVLPIGTGNDFAFAAGLPRAAQAAADCIAAGVTRDVDVARMNDTWFANNCAAAMEPLVTLENIRIRRISGNLRYVVSLVRALRKLRPWDMHVRWDDGEYRGPVYLLSACNGPRCGGVFPMAPSAAIDDGLLDVVLVPQVPALTVGAILLRLMRGRHLGHPAVRSFRTARLDVTSDPPTPVHADGEMVGEGLSSLSFAAERAALRIIVPATPECPP